MRRRGKIGPLRKDRRERISSPLERTSIPRDSKGHFSLHGLDSSKVQEVDEVGWDGSVLEDSDEEGKVLTVGSCVQHYKARIYRRTVALVRELCCVCMAAQSVICLK